MTDEAEINKRLEAISHAGEKLEANYDASIIRDLTGRVPNELTELLEKLDNEKAS